MACIINIYYINVYKNGGNMLHNLIKCDNKETNETGDK